MASISNDNIATTIQYSEQLGRFDFASILLTSTAVIVAAIGVLLFFGGIFGFLNIKNSAKREAKIVAEIHSKEVAERVANEHMQQYFPEIVRAYDELGKNLVSQDEAGEITQAWESQKEVSNEHSL